MKKSGQTMLIAVIMIFTAAISIGLAVAIMGLSQISIVQNLKLASQANNQAESCLENALMRITRDDLTNPLPLSFTSGTCTINISGTAPNYTLTAVAQIPTPLGGGKLVNQKIEAQINITDHKNTVTGWQKIY